MRLMMKLLLCLCLTPVGIMAQAQINKVMVGPVDGQTRIIIGLMDATQDSYLLQTMIVDVKPIKKADEAPTFFQLDLTSTNRSLATGEKKQKVFLLRWKSPSEIEVRCDGKWTKQEATPEISSIVEITQAVMKNVPLDAKKPTEATLEEDVQKKVISTFVTLSAPTLPCVKNN